MTRVKICGIRTELAFDTAVEAGADWIGFVFFPASPRYVSPQVAAGLSSRMSGGPPRIGLFVAPSDAMIGSVLDTVRLDGLQVYGQALDIPRLKARFGLPIWQSVGVVGRADLPTGAQQADMMLIEPKPSAEATRPGGNATSFDWSILQGWKPPKPWLLAGGLTPHNVADAIKVTGATAVDVSSGVERMKGVKDPALIWAFIRAAKASTAQPQEGQQYHEADRA